MKKLTQLLSLLFTLTILLAACGGDDDDDNNDDNNDDTGPVDVTIDINDPTAVSDEIVIAGATSIDGALPTPTTTDPDTPVLEVNTDDLISTQGGALLIDIDVSSGDVAGTYIQIEGADSYFDIPFNPNGRVLKRGRLLQEDDEPVIEIQIPDGLGAGTFCAEICVYDSEARVSSPITRCVTIEELGGDNSSFLTENSWSAVGFKEVEESGEIDEYAVGELIEDTFSTSLECADGTFEEVEVIESDRTDKLDVTFSANGGVTIDISEFEIDLNFNTSTCEVQVYDEEQSTTQLQGTWSYNDTSKKLIMILEVISSTFTEDIGDLEVIEFKVEFDAATSSLSLVEDGETIFFEPS